MPLSDIFGRDAAAALFLHMVLQRFSGGYLDVSIVTFVFILSRSASTISDWMPEVSMDLSACLK